MSERCDNNMFQFTKSCMVGVEQIDTEHQYLFEVMNNLMDVLQNTTDVKQEKAQLEEYIPVLIDYGENHFKHEEAYMESIQDAELPRQKREHASFLSKMRSIDLADLDFAEKKVLMEDVLKYTIRWLYRHILNSDTLIGKVHHLKKDEETFSYCVFSSKYYTGIKAIDEEHERLFDIINEAYTLVEEQYNENVYDDIMHVLDELEEHLGYPVTWDEDENGNPILTNNTYTGSYIHGDHKHAITVEQTQYNQTQAVDGSEIRYQRKSSYYYVTYFVMTVDEEEPMSFTVTYTDGEANKASFKDHSYGISKLEDETVYAPVFPYAPTWEGHLFKGWLQEGGDGTLLTTEQIGQMTVEQNMVFHAQWQKLFSVYFHANNSASNTADVFRTYRSHASMVQAGDYRLNNGAVGVFYDIPTFAYDVHNGYIFKGWYMGTGEDAAPMDWNATYTEETHIYAHWIKVGQIAKEDDGKRYEADTYPEYDLLGNQIRVATENPGDHYGDAAPGLRFIAALSERVYAELNGLHTNNGGGVEYGFLLARADAVNTADMLKYKHASLNGEDTTSSHAYVNNVPCRVAGRPVDDHYAGETYRLYTAVITYKNLTGDTLTAAQNTNFVGRAYIRYFDANGLERVHYNNYTGESKTCGGVNTCYAQVQALLNGL